MNVVDRERRDKFAELLRHFAAGRITNEQWEMTALKIAETDDPAPGVMWGTMWHTYDSIHEHRLTEKHRLTSEWRRLVARMILFLYSDLPYEWPAQRPYKGWEFAIALLTLGIINRNPPVEHPLKNPANKELWPFFRPEDLKNAAAARPRLLGGKS